MDRWRARGVRSYAAASYLHVCLALDGLARVLLEWSGRSLRLTNVTHILMTHQEASQGSVPPNPVDRAFALG